MAASFDSKVGSSSVLDTRTSNIRRNYWFSTYAYGEDRRVFCFGIYKLHHPWNIALWYQWLRFDGVNIQNAVWIVVLYDKWFCAPLPLKSGQVLYSSPLWVAKRAVSLSTAPNMHLAQLHHPCCPCLAIVCVSDLATPLETFCVPLKCTPGSLHCTVLFWRSFILTSASGASGRPCNSYSA
jgi:hypothetical protein